MKVRIHFTWPNGTEDAVVLESDDLEELRAQAHHEVESRHATNPWSEVLEE